MIYVYRRASSTGARELATALAGGVRWRGRRAGHRDAVLVPADKVVCWGEAAPGGLPAGVQVLNGAPLRSKFDDAAALGTAGVRTVEVRRQRPATALAAVAAPVVDPAAALWTEAAEAADNFAELDFARGPVASRVVTDLAGLFMRLNGAMAAAPPAPRVAAPAATWLPRLNNHVGGTDLLRPPAAPEYYSKKEEFVSEIRIHCFQGRSIRAGRKVIREGFTPGGGRNQVPHPWIRSYEGGWSIRYDGFESSAPQRALAAAAIEALNLDFGAVDIGLKAGGELVVLEVNRAPGLEGGTVASYATAIQSWAAGEVRERLQRAAGRRQRAA